jgi:transcriptional regulator with GAF, ATPase, and Fis domain
LVKSSSQRALVGYLQALSQAVPKRMFLGGVLDDLAEMLDSERVFLFKLRAQAGFHVLLARGRDREDLSGGAERLSHFAIARMVRSERPVFVADASRDRRYRTEEVLQGKKRPLSIVVLPIHVRGALRGGVYADHRFKHLKYPPRDLESVEALVSVLSLALLLREVSRRKRGGPGEGTAKPSGGSGGVARLHVPGGEPELFHGLMSVNPDMRDIFDTIRSLAPSDIPVLIQGETGTGKGVLARAVHESSSRGSNPYVCVHCGSVPETLIESEIMGHVKGAFTGADLDREGVFVTADGGTLLLDEVADMSLELQKKLLRVLEDGLVRPVGAKDPVRVDVRLVCSTSGDLEKLVKEGVLRRDLYHRLKGVVVHLPPLRERREDILPLAAHFLQEYAREEGRSAATLGEGAKLKMLGYSWPGNVRELEHEMRRLVALGVEEIGAEHLALSARRQDPFERDADAAEALTLEEAVAEAEKQAISVALKSARGNKSRAAAQLGITRKALYRRMAKYGIPGGGELPRQ